MGEKSRTDAKAHAAAEARRRVRYHNILHEKDPRFEAAFDLYEQTFPREERSTREQFHQTLLSKRLGRLWPSSYHMIAASLDDKVVGMGSGRYMASANIGYVAYLVVRPDHGRRRIGPTIRNHLITAFKHDAQLAGHERLEAVVGEVHHDNRWLKILAGRGQVIALDIDYRQPPLKDGLEEVDLVLYYQPMGPVPEALSAARVREIVQALFREVYFMKDPDSHPTFRAFVGKLEGRHVVGHRRLTAPRKGPSQGPPGADGAKRDR